MPDTDPLPVVNAESRYQGLTNRPLGGVAPHAAAPHTTERQKIAKIKADLLQTTTPGAPGAATPSRVSSRIGSTPLTS